MEVDRFGKELILPNSDGSNEDADRHRWPEAVAAIRLLAPTGCRRINVLDCRWRDIGNDILTLSQFASPPLPSSGGSTVGGVSASKMPVRRPCEPLASAK